MSTFKTQIEAEAVTSFVHEHFGSDTVDIKMIVGGEVSQAGIVETSNGSKVVRFSKHSEEGYRKDKFAYEHFRSPLVPIPEVEEIGTLPNGLFYAVSELMPGTTLDKLPADEIKATLPSLLRTLDAIHQIAPIGDGFGLIQLDGNGNTGSWHEALDRSIASNYEDKLKTIIMFEHDLYDRCRTKIKEYFEYCPSDIRHLIHRDFGFDNTLAEKGQITGVIDWDDAAYGDPLYDIAWQSFWSSGFSWSREIDIFAAIRQHYIDTDQLPENFEERVNCYKMIIGINSLTFFAKSDQKDSYGFVRKELIKLESEM